VAIYNVFASFKCGSADVVCVINYVRRWYEILGVRPSARRAYFLRNFAFLGPSSSRNACSLPTEEETRNCHVIPPFLFKTYVLKRDLRLEEERSKVTRILAQYFR